MLTQTDAYRIILSSGEVKWIVSFSRPILAQHESHTKSLISSFDITPYLERTQRLEDENDILHKRNRELTRQLSIAFNAIGNSECEIVDRNRGLKETNMELLEANSALKVLAKNLDTIKRKTEERLLNDIYKNIYPLLAELKNADAKVSIDILIENLLIRVDELCRALGNESRNFLRKYLSATEIKIAVMIKDGLRSSEIAEQLKVSVATVKTHRKNIRRKLKIQNSKINLSSYLKLKWHNSEALVR